MTKLLLQAGATVSASEPAPAMLARARTNLESFGTEVSLQQGDAWSLSIANDWGDAAVAGWVFGHFRAWYPEQWRSRVADAITEMRRCIVASGPIVIVETLGTGKLAPSPPSDAAAEYYDELESQHGLRCEIISTDYSFDDVETAANVLGEFFGRKRLSLYGTTVGHAFPNGPESGQRRQGGARPRITGPLKSATDLDFPELPKSKETKVDS